jgi:hypothetical protein
MHCENLIEGRLSFQGENIEIERLMELEQQAKKQNNKRAYETDTSDEQMAKMWKNSRNISMHKFVHHKKESSEPKRKKLKFIKPKD